MPEATVATFNIRHGRGLDGRVDLLRTADAIHRCRADLVALQELDRFNPRSAGADQPAELERLTGLRITFVPTVARAGWEYGIALAVRGPARPEVEVVDLPRLANEEPRRAAVARWLGLGVVATHLAVEPTVNAAQQEALERIVAPLLPGAVILGDLNRGVRALGWLGRAGVSAARVFGGTLHPWWSFRRIDHVLAGPAVTMARPRTVPTRASDHRPVAVQLRWRVEDVASVTYDG